MKKATKAEMREWPKRAMDILCMRLMTFAVKRRPNLVLGMIMQKANELGVRTTMHILDQEGIYHCHACPKRFSLKKVGQGYACPDHTPKREEVKAGVRQTAAAAA